MLYGGDVENNTWMFGNMKFISSVDQDISRVSKVNKWDILLDKIRWDEMLNLFNKMRWDEVLNLFNTRNHFIIFPNIHVLFCLLYKKLR